MLLSTFEKGPDKTNKNHQNKCSFFVKFQETESNMSYEKGGLDYSADESDEKMFETPDDIHSGCILEEIYVNYRKTWN